MTKLFLSHRLDLLANHLSDELANDGHGIFMPRLIVVPNSSLKQWVSIQIAQHSKEKGTAGCKAVTLHEALSTLSSPSGFTEIFCSLYHELADCQDGIDLSPRRIAELADRLTDLFIRYGHFCPSLFKPDGTTEEWQKQLIQKLFVSGKLRLPLQMPPFSFAPIHCFGFDYLPPAIWKLFNFRSIFLFSPCSHFWEDLCTDRERKRLIRFWKEKGASEEKREELDSYLKGAPPLLANWGRAGRETLKILDSLVEEIEEDYRIPEIEWNSTLVRLRKKILSFTPEEKSCYPQDSSIQLSKTGSSLLGEIEHLRISILRLMEEQQGLLFSDIAVLAPDIQRYASLIQFVFSDIPFRISGLEMGSRSFFYQGLHRFFELDDDSESFMSLFENPSFCRARDWNLDVLEQLREWLLPLDLKESETQLLDQFVYLFPEENKRISNASADILEQWIEIYQSLRSDQASLQQPRTLSDWSKWLMKLVQKYFSIDPSDEADTAAWSYFQRLMRELQEADSGSQLFPFAPIQALLNRSNSGGQIHASHLHAVRFASIAEGALTFSRALFLIGMDEENFPRRSSSSSLNLIQFEKIYPFASVDQDRYFFLQALFTANEYIHFSYSHLSSEGHPVNPSPLIEELIRSLDAPIKENKATYRPLIKKSPKASFHWPDTPSLELPKGERTVSLSDLSSLARHPWAFYLEKKFGIRFDDSEEESFSRQKARILRSHLQTQRLNFLSDLPTGICGEAIKIDLNEKAKNWDDLIRSWDVLVEPVSFRMCCREKMRCEKGWEFPGLELDITPSLHIKLVGEVKTFSDKGFIHAGNDSLEGLLRVWPECLAALAASGRREIYCLKSGKIKTVDQPHKALKAYIYYYFLSLSAPSPLLADWADPILRKNPEEWEKKISDKMFGKGVRFEDPVWDWVVGRVDLPSADNWFDRWGLLLRENFSELMTVYAQRRKVL